MTEHQPTVLQANPTDGKRLDVLGGVLKVLSDPTHAAGLGDILSRNPARISIDPSDPSAALRTNANGTVERGQLTDDGQFVPTNGVGLRAG
ncbi:hypothetical protein ASF19_17590 [Acidovorax sp. Leaf84]|uniref:hypothetical protein n=1 Tax=Acidovorax sp. Leaf84 TaxID=1736240 RepID=UPI0007142F4E|nr:hypothetical protein [Acidovorax sp. Leaf84]KQO28796.1 hypothetical protein ASF19_17590 [Acidovorax sp. Leaf84]